MTEHEKTAEVYREQRSRILHGLADRARPSPLIWLDLPGYDSPVTGKWIEGRVARREDLKRNECVEYDPGMKDDAKRNEKAREEKLDRIIGEAAERMYNQLPESKRNQLDREMTER